jgi:hypothetical protein
MATRPRVNSTVMERKIRATVTASRVSAQAGVRELGAAAVDVLDTLSPKDTHRYVNAWILAGRDAGVTDKQPYPYNESRRAQAWLDELAKEEAAFARSVARYQAFKDLSDRADAARAGQRKKNGKGYAKRATTRSYRDNVRKLRAAEKRLARVRQEIAKAAGNPGFVFFSARFSKRNYSTVRTAIFGGTGSLKMTPRGPVVSLTNKEPHARPVEKNPNLGHPVATTKALLGAVGTARAGRAYRADLRKRSPMAA